MNAFVKMKRTMEILNLLVGFELILVGIIYLIRLDISSAASWAIFGGMYIVMDTYSVLENMSKNRKLVEAVKYGSAWLGFLISSVFLVYIYLKG